jgi:hypothetical protein
MLAWSVEQRRPDARTQGNLRSDAGVEERGVHPNGALRGKQVGNKQAVAAVKAAELSLQDDAVVDG